MRILYFTRALTSHDERFMRAFDQHGMESGILSLRAPGRPQGSPGGGESLGNLGLAASADSRELEAAVEGYRRAVKQFSPDIVVAGPVLDCGYVAALAASPVPWVAQSWAFDVLWENEKSEDARWRTRFALLRCSALFADCQAVLAKCSELVGREFPLHFVMPWGLEASPGTLRGDAPRLDPGGGVDSERVFIHTRGLEPIYYPELLFESWKRFVRAGGNGVLLLASDGSLKKEMEGFVLREGLSGSTRFLGRLTHGRMLEVFAAADFYVSCAASDGTSISLLEAMAAGLPAIVNDRGGNREWVTPGRNGWVVPFGDPIALAQALSDAASKPAPVIREISIVNRAEVAQRADWKSNFNDYIEFIKGVLEMGRGF